MLMSVAARPEKTAAWCRLFAVLWVLATLAKCLIAWRLPLFVDEAFYWQEGQHLALAYSDLPGLTAWLARLGVELGGTHPLALRAPFLLLGAALPWLVVWAAKVLADDARACQAGLLALLMPLSAPLGVLALPDVPMAVATALCLGAGARLLQRVQPAAVALLALGLVLGALSHYRFAAVIAVGAAALLALRQGRVLLKHPAVLAAVAVGALAWLPLVWWNGQNADAGLKFQLLERHPWAFHPEGIRFVLIQPLLATPLLFWLFLRLAGSGLDAQRPDAWRYFALSGGLSTLGFFLLGFFADNERVSFHWTLPGYLALLVLVPHALAQAARIAGRLLWGTVAVGGLASLALHGAIASPAARAFAAGQKWYPDNFAGWQELADATRAALADAPPGTLLVADNFKIGAQLGFVLDNPAIPVLDHPLNYRHGRAVQLQLWGLTAAAEATGVPKMLVIGVDDVRYKELLQHYHRRRQDWGNLRPWRSVNVDHGARRFVLTAPAEASAHAATPFTAPALAWVDTIEAGQRLGAQFEVAGWAFREGVGLARVEVLLDGRVVAEAEYGLARPEVAGFWGISQDPAHPHVGFRARVDARGLAAGRHWLGLRLHGRDGAVEEWAEIPVRILEH